MGKIMDRGEQLTNEIRDGKDSIVPEEYKELA